MTTGKGPADSAGKIIARLEAALSQDGDFPVRAKVVNELRKLVNDPKTPIERIVELILSEPALGTRILHIVNSVYYMGAVPVMTVSQAVVRLGMRSLSDLCTGLVLLQRFSPAARRGGIFADNVKKCILTSLLTSSLSHIIGDKDEERGYLAGTFFSIGPLLLAYYFPQVFEAAEERAAKRGKTVTQSVTESLGIPPVALSLGVVDGLAIPQFYRDVLVLAFSLYVGEASRESTVEDYVGLANAVATAGRLADAIVDSHTRLEFSHSLDEISQISGYSREQLMSVLTFVPNSFRQHCKTIDMSFLELPDHFITFIETKDIEAKGDDEQEGVPLETQFSYYSDEIREAITNGETMSSIITSAMEALAFGLKFDRVLLMFSDTSTNVLRGKMALGESFSVDAHSFTVDLSEDEDSPAVMAYTGGNVETYGEPLFQDGWPFAAIPIGSSIDPIGVIYADKMSRDGQEQEALSDGTQVGLNMLAELLDKALLANE